MTNEVEPGLSIDCADVVELVTDYLEGVLDEATVAEIDAHLALCDGCSTYLAQFRATIATVGHLPAEALTSEATADLVAAFRSAFPE